MHKITTNRANFKRQIGSERNLEPLPIINPKPSARKITLSRIAIITTITMWVVYLVHTLLREFSDTTRSYEFRVEAIGYFIVVSFLILSALMYLIAREGALIRFSKHIRTPRAELDRHFSNTKVEPSITILVPSYSEEPEVIRKTLMSAALQEYPDTRIVLLIDDNPNPSSSNALEKLNQTRNTSNDIMELLSEPKKRTKKSWDNFRRKHTLSEMSTDNDAALIIQEYNWVISWLNNQADKEEVKDHVDQFFSNQVLRALADDLQVTSNAVEGSRYEGVAISAKRIDELYRRLAWIFDAEISVFERKKYASLSHEANKAMNLNSYIGLMGGSYMTTPTPNGPALLPTKNKAKADLVIPDSDYLLTLDADSILLREYCLRLVHLMEQPDNSRVAVSQTPYSSFRGAATRTERLSGATTDIQYLIHQGMTYYNATFWVGANAVIRKKALEDIVESELVGGFRVRRFIQDRTVIEDTESSIDLVNHNWTLVNYPERLSYSATPPDFGSLVVQRRRWANGGLLIMPKLISHIKERKRLNLPVSKIETLLRVNYMSSIAWSSFGLVFLLAYPYDGRLLSPVVLLAAAPYFIAMASDLKSYRYKRTDIFRIYGFNLILLPVNLAGVLKSIQQALSGRKIPFARTPKIKNRTATPALYAAAPLLIIGFSIFTMLRNIDDENWGNATFAAFNALAATWATISYIGIINIFKDIFIGVIDWLFVPDRVKKSEPPVEPGFDWRSALYHGNIANDAMPLSAYESSDGIISKKEQA